MREFNNGMIDLGVCLIICSIILTQCSPNKESTITQDKKSFEVMVKNNVYNCSGLSTDNFKQLCKTHVVQNFFAKNVVSDELKQQERIYIENNKNFGSVKDKKIEFYYNIAMNNKVFNNLKDYTK